MSRLKVREEVVETAYKGKTMLDLGWVQDLRWLRDEVGGGKEPVASFIGADVKDS
jgi:hypothetical protein